MTESNSSEAQAFLDSESESSESLTVQELLRKLRTLERKNDRLRMGEQIIRDQVAISLGGERIRLAEVETPKQGKGREEIAVLHVSDTQIGKATESYSSQVAVARLELLTRKALRIVNERRKTARVRDLRIYLGGDIVEGENIFPGQAHLIDDSVFDQACRTAPCAIAALIWNLARQFDTTTVQSVYGNHGRPGSKSAGSHPRTNWDRVSYESARLMLLGSDEMPNKAARKRITFNIADSFYAVDRVFDWGNLVVHGHQIRGGFAGFPWYGAGKKTWGWADSIPEPWDYLWFGHFHTYASAVLNHRIFLANGTTESDNDYALEELAAAGHPCQRLAFFTAEHGLTADYQVFLTDAGKRIPQAARRGA